MLKHDINVTDTVAMPWLPAILSRCIYQVPLLRGWIYASISPNFVALRMVRSNARRKAYDAFGACALAASALLAVGGIDVVDNMKLEVDECGIHLIQGSRHGAYSIPLSAELAQTIEVACRHILVEAIGCESEAWVTRAGWELRLSPLSRHAQMAALARCSGSA
jgi:hypothetical protein